MSRQKQTVPRPGKLSKTANPLSDMALRILKRVVAGEALLGFRTFPHPFRYRLSGVNGVGACSVTQGVVQDLASLNLINDASRSSTKSDAILYVATEAGKKLATDGPPPPDDSQLDWTAA